MPYSKWEEVNPAIKGIEPRVTLAQANMIAGWADRIEEADNPWAVAIAQFKKMYEVKDGKWVKEEDTAENLKETWVPYGVISFEQVEAREEARKKADQINDLTYAYCDMVANIMVMDEIENKISEINRLTGEFTSRLGALMEAEQIEKIRDEDGDMVELAENEESPIESLQESDTGPLHAIVRVIKPGWGNKKHNHYYPKDVLEKDAYQFIGAKMFETDHRPQEKSTRTWVSTVEDIVGFDEGAPLAKVAVHDAGFAERLQNLNKLGMLEKMECSIYANGLAKGGFKLNGREGKQVESITSVSSVDWVTRAGAGGAAVSLMENDEELNMNKELEEKQEDEVQEEVQEEQESAEEQVEEVEIQEQEEEQPELLEVSAVKDILSETDLPDYAQTRLAYSGRFMSAEEVKEAAEAELQYIKTVTRSGQPFGQTKRKEKQVDKVDKIAEAEKAKDKLASDLMRIGK